MQIKAVVMCQYFEILFLILIVLPNLKVWIFLGYTETEVEKEKGSMDWPTATKKVRGVLHWCVGCLPGKYESPRIDYTNITYTDKLRHGRRSPELKTPPHMRNETYIQLMLF